MSHFGMDGIIKTTDKKPARYVKPVSVSGFFHAFRIVGMAANPSPRAAKSIAKRGESIPIQSNRAKTEQAPQSKSKVVNFQ